MTNSFDVIVIGGGHAGIEAAASSARMGALVCLITIKEDNIGHMPCNPAIGGIGKGHIVFEIEALGGIMPRICSLSYLQANMLNLSKGPAVQGLRLQIDKSEYKKQALNIIKQYKNITLIYDIVVDFITDNEKKIIEGVITKNGTSYFSKAVIVTSGTFLNGLIHMGLTQQNGGRFQEQNTTHLSEKIKSLGISLGRFKTGTPARIEEKSINFSILEEQKSHNLDGLFEYLTQPPVHKKSCFVTHTNKDTHSIILSHAHLSPIYRGDICGIAPRYCPSIEDKIKRFQGKDSHHIFIEPEGFFSHEWYPNGLSTSLPIDIQEQFLRTIKGLEQVKITKPGYAIEYDFIYPHQLTHTLEVKHIEGLFFAGQINGTTGYEEAAGQGIVAGINAAAKVLHISPLILSRTESYIGIMIDDLVTLGTDEPYRMFTSRAERRLFLRQDNVFHRLYKYAKKYQLISEDTSTSIASENQEGIELVKQLEKKQTEISTLFSNQQITQVHKIIYNCNSSISPRIRDFVMGELLYLPYYAREEHEIKKMKTYETLSIPHEFKFQDIPGLSIEMQQKLTYHQPKTIAQASLIQGVTPSAISLLIFKINHFEHRVKN